MQQNNNIVPGDGIIHERNLNGGTSDIIAEIVRADKLNAGYVKDFAAALPVQNVYDACLLIWQWIKANVPYQEDPDGYQFVQSPGELYNNRFANLGGTGKGGDCKSYSNFASGVLKCLGIKHFYRAIGQDTKEDLHHVYICVPTSGSEYIVIDATPEITRDNAGAITGVIEHPFNHEYKYVKKKDFWADMNVPVSAPNSPMPARIAGIGATAPAVLIAPRATPGFWVDMIEDYKRTYAARVNTLGDMVIADLKNKWLPAHPIKFSLFADANKKHYSEFREMAYALAYHFWDDTDVPLPPELEAKRAFGFQLYNELVKIGYREATLRTMCDLSTFNLYGAPLDYMIYRSKCITKYGQPWQPVNGVPYWNMKTGTLVNNGAPTLDMAFQIAACFPYMPYTFSLTSRPGGTFEGELPANAPQAIGLPSGAPYWSVGGFLMPNGATNDAIAEYLKVYPTRPPINLQNNPTQQSVTDAVRSYNKWLDGNIVALPVIDAGTISNRPGAERVSGIGDYGISATGIIAIVVAVVSAVATVAGVVSKIVADIKLSKDLSNGVIPEFKGDFKEIYQTVDGCIMYQSVSNGAYKKCCPNGQCQDNPDLNDDRNKAGAGSFGSNPQSLGKILLIGGGLLFLFALVFGGGKSKD